MCKHCYNSELGLARRKEQEDAALGFKAGMPYKGYEDPAYIAAHKRCVEAGKAMWTLHNDYIFAMARERAQAGIIETYITHADKRGR